MTSVQSWIWGALFYLTCPTGLIKSEAQAGKRWREQCRDRSVLQEATQPQRLIHSIHSQHEIRHDWLNTRVKNNTSRPHFIHLAQASFLIEAFSTSFILDLELNHNLLSSEYIERHFGEEGKPTETPGGEHCYYHGKIRGNPDSFAAISTCHGLNGVFYDGNYTYIIEPRSCEDGEQPHVLYRSPGLDISPECTLFAHFTDNATQMNSYEGVLRPRMKRQVRRGKHTVLRETKYIELMIVNDQALFEKQRSSVTLTNNFAKSVVNLADMIYKDQLNTRIVLVAMETWASGNKIDVSDYPLVTLTEFMKYRRRSIKDHSDAIHLLSGRTFKSSHSAMAFIGGICTLSKGGGVNEYGSVGAMAVTLGQSLGQNLGMMWNKLNMGPGECRCPDEWLGCIMEDTGYYLPQRFSRCSLGEYSHFLQAGGGICLFNKPSKLFDPPNCGNGFVETGEECDCGNIAECVQPGDDCCKKCTLTHSAMCSSGLCCRGCQYEPRGTVCRHSVNECDIAETCTGDSSQCPWNVHKLDGYSCDSEQGRCYNGGCKTRDRQCSYTWGHSSADRFCYEKLNVEGTEKGNCGKEGQSWLQCPKQDVLCGYLLCSNITQPPKHGELSGEVTSMVLYHQNKYMDCRGAHVLLDDGTDLGYVEDGTLCGPNMMCLDHKCLPMQAFNQSSCPRSASGDICFGHGVCSNEVKCICFRDWTGKDCSVFDPIPDPTPIENMKPQYKGPSGTNIIIGSIAGAILVGAIVLGGTGWGFKNIRRGRYDPTGRGRF